MDHVLEYMKKHNIPLTRQRYLDLAYLGNPPAELSAEEESELPEEIKQEPTAGLRVLGGNFNVQ